MDLGCSCPCIHTGWCFDFWILKISPKIILTRSLLMFWHLYLFWFWTFGNPGWLAGLLLLFETGWRALVYESVDAGEVSCLSICIFSFGGHLFYILCVSDFFSFLSFFSSYARSNNPRKSYQSMSITTRPAFNLSGLNANLYM